MRVTITKIINCKSFIKNQHQKSPSQDHQSRVILTNMSQLLILFYVALVQLLPMFLIGDFNPLEAEKMMFCLKQLGCFIASKTCKD